MAVMLKFDMNIDAVEAELERLQHPPVTKLEGVLASNFAVTEARVHVITGKLKGSGHPSSEFASDVWTGTLSFDRDPGIFELARGPRRTRHHGGMADSHFFFDPVEARWPGDWTTGDSYQMYTKTIEDFLGGAVSTTNDRNDPRLMHGADVTPVPQAEVYLVMSDEEIAQGFVRPVYRMYKHHDPECEYVTTMALPLCETYAANPGYYGATYCCGCRMHRPVGVHGEFTWIDAAGNDTGILVGT